MSKANENQAQLMRCNNKLLIL